MRHFVLVGITFSMLLGLQVPVAFGQNQVMQAEDSSNCAASGMCYFPACWEGDIQPDPTTIQLTSVDLLEPDDPKGADAPVWTSFQGADVNADVAQAAMQSMQNALQTQHFAMPCVEQDCSCAMPAGVPPWGNPQNTSINQGFSIPSPVGNSRLYYTAHATVQAKGRFKSGFCNKERIEE